MKNIHPTAFVHPQAKIGENVEIGPFCIVGENVEIGDNCKLVSGVVIDGNTIIGCGNRFFHAAVIGTAPQDLKYNGEPTKLIIGDNNIFREFVTVNRSALTTEATTVGNNCLIMTYAHIAHNCHIGNNAIIANAVNIAGHVHIHDFVTIGGMTAIHQFVKIGKYAFIGGVSGVKKDVPPYTRGEGMPYRAIGLNSVGLRRKDFSTDKIEAIKQIYRIFYQSSLNVSQALKKAEKLTNLTAEQTTFIEFVKNSERGICK